MNKQQQKETQLRIVTYLGGPVFFVMGISFLAASKLVTTDMGIATAFMCTLSFALAGILLFITIMDLGNRIKKKIGRKKHEKIKP